MLLLLACASVSYDVADLQVDVEAALPETAEKARICVKEVGMLEEGAGNGRLAMAGLPEGEPAEVTVAIFDAAGAVLGHSEPVLLQADTPYRTTVFVDGAEGCEAAGTMAEGAENSWLLAVRFTGSGW